jgi:hypothetical protein
MNFLKELSLNDLVEIQEYVAKTKTVFSITKEAKMVFALELNWE